MFWGRVPSIVGWIFHFSLCFKAGSTVPFIGTRWGNWCRSNQYQPGSFCAVHRENTRKNLLPACMLSGKTPWSQAQPLVELAWINFSLWGRNWNGPNTLIWREVQPNSTVWFLPGVIIATWVSELICQPCCCLVPLEEDNKFALKHLQSGPTQLTAQSSWLVYWMSYLLLLRHDKLSHLKNFPSKASCE